MHDEAHAGVIAGSAATRPWRLLGVAVALASLALGLGGAAVMIVEADAAFLALSEPLFRPAHAPHPVSPDVRLGQSIGFAFFAAVSLVQALLLARIGDRELPLIARSLLAGHALWYALDSAGSWVSGAVGNVVTNTGYALLLALPLLALSRRR